MRVDSKGLYLKYLDMESKRIASKDVLLGFMNHPVLVNRNLPQSFENDTEMITDCELVVKLTASPRLFNI